MAKSAAKVKLSDEVEQTLESIWASQAQVVTILREVKHQLRNKVQIELIKAKRYER